jgi:2-oxoglutarate ferredoxin oxidoreductase subunit delta
MADKKNGKIIINRELCKGCYLCVSVCPNGVITVSETLNQQGYHPAESITDVKSEKKCVGCAMCATICPDVAIEVYRE